MRRDIGVYVQSIARDNEGYIREGGYDSIADYIISHADNGDGWHEYFDDSETEANYGEPTEEQVDEVRTYLRKYYGYLPEKEEREVL